MTANHRALDDSDIALIERVKLTPPLYDPRNPDFRLAHRKEQEWEKVATFLGLTAADARRRWTCLRDRYSRELKQLRLNPDKGEFGKNDFFRLMDFLRKFVRKRRERRRNTTITCSWESQVDVPKLTAKISLSDEDDDEEKTVYSETQQNYEHKMEAQTTESAQYPEFVEVDASETYEEYVEQQATEISNSSSTTKAINNTLMPIMLPPTNATTYTLTTEQAVPLQQQTQQQPQQQHHRIQSPQSHDYNKQLQTTTEAVANETADDFFCKSIAAYLRQLSRRHKIKAKVEMFQILEKYIELEENFEASSSIGHMQKS